MADALLQTLTIKLNAEVGNTKRKLKDVATSVEKLEEIGKKADWSVFEQIRTNLEGIAKIDFSNVADSLKDVVTAMKALGISAKQVKNMPVMSAPQMEDSLSGESIEEPSWNLKDAIVPFASLLSSELKSANAQFSILTKQTSEYVTVIDVLKDRLKGAGFSLEQISYVMSEWKNLEAPVANFDELLNVLEELGFSANKVNEILANIGSSNGFGSWGEELKECGVTASEVTTIMKDLFNVTREPIDFSALEQALLRLGFTAEQAKAEMEKLGKPTELDLLKQKLAECNLNGQQLKVVLDEITKSKAEPVDFEQLKNVLISLGISAQDAEAIMAKLGKATKKAGKDAENSAKGFKKMLNSIKRITFYRMVRRAIQLIGQAITQGIQDIALFDADFNKSMSEIKSSLTYFKNSLGAIIAPVVEMIQPILAMFLDMFAGINNELGKMFAMLNGKNQFAKATKGAEDYAESLKKAQSVSLGIDELNVAQKQEAQNFATEETGGGSNALGDLFANLKDSLEPLIEKFKEGFMPILEAIMNVFNALSPILNIVVDLFTQLIGETMDGVNKSIADFVNMIAQLLKFVGSIINGLKPLLEMIIHFISTLINIFNESLSVLFEVLGDLFSVLSEIVNEIMTILKPFFDIIKVIFNAINDTGKEFINFFKNAIYGLLEGLVTVLKVIVPILRFISGALGVNIDERSTGERIFWGILSLGGSELLGALQKVGSHANGGFVEDGFFYANHNELVGQFSNGQTAVANNAQIVEGIKQGVMDAIIESGGLGGSQGSRDIVIQIDGREIGRASEKYEAQKGEKIFSGGYHYGY